MKTARVHIKKAIANAAITNPLIQTFCTVDNFSTLANQETNAGKLIAKAIPNIAL